MRLSFMHRYRLHFSLAILSSAIIAFQLSLMQILSITQWYHFAYMVISVAMLGFGAAGTVLAIFRTQLLQNTALAVPLLMSLCSISMALVVTVSQTQLFRFDSFLVFSESAHAGKLVLTYLLFLVPFFFGALAIGIVFTKEVAQIPKLYFANLLGSGIGGAGVLPLFSALMPEQIPAVIAALPAIAGILIMKKRPRWLAGLVFVGILVSMAIWLNPPRLKLSQFKDLSKTLLLPGTEIETSQNGPYGLLQTVSSEALRYGPGLSLTSTVIPSIEGAVFVDGNWIGPTTDLSDEDFANVLNHSTTVLPFVIDSPDNVLLLNAGTAPRIAQVFSHGNPEITVVEENGPVAELIRGQLQRAGIASVGLHKVDSRYFIAQDTTSYDLIALPMIGAFGGTNGIYATMEQFLLTAEGFDQMWHRLTDDGILEVSCWMDYPVRNPLKILATLVEVLERNGVDMQQHLAVIRSWGTVTFVVKKAPLSDIEIERIRAFCDSMQFDPVLLPGIREEEREYYNRLQDNAFFQYIDILLSPARDTFYTGYAFNIKPATDNKPYFSQFLRWQSVTRLSEVFGSRLPFFEVGYLIVVVTLAQITVVALLLIILPLFRIGWKGGNKSGVLLYFGGIGLGYMLVEVLLIQRLTLYFGNPVYAAAAAICGVLVFSGIGSYMSERLLRRHKELLLVLFLVVAMLICYAMVFTAILQSTIAMSFLLKIGIATALIAPLAICMGMPFPAGLSMLSRTSEQQIPWAWGVNACASVISAPLAIVLAVEFGFTAVVWVAVMAYCLPLIAIHRKVRK